MRMVSPSQASLHPTAWWITEFNFFWRYSSLKAKPDQLRCHSCVKQGICSCPHRTLNTVTQTAFWRRSFFFKLYQDFNHSHRYGKLLEVLAVIFRSVFFIVCNDINFLMLNWLKFLAFLPSSITPSAFCFLLFMSTYVALQFNLTKNPLNGSYFSECPYALPYIILDTYHSALNLDA